MDMDKSFLKKIVVIVSSALTIIFVLFSLLCILVYSEVLKNDFIDEILFAIGVQNEAEEYLEDFLVSYKNKDENLSKYFSKQSNSEDVDYSGFQGLFCEQLDFKIIETRKNSEDKFETVYFTVTNVDFKSVFDDMMDELGQDASTTEYMSHLERQMKSKDCKKRKFECETQVFLGDEKMIIVSESLSNALFGGFNEYLSELTAVEKEMEGQ